MKKDTKRFLVLMAIPAIVILGFVAYIGLTVTTGDDILLEVPRPIDPKDLFRGNYVALDYSIGRIDMDQIPSDAPFDSRQTIYASLSKKDEYWTIDSVSHKKPALSENQVCLRGEVERVYRDTVSIEWGIESFFAPEDMALHIEEQRSEVAVSAVVRIDSRCNAILRLLNAGNETFSTR